MIVLCTVIPLLEKTFIFDLRYISQNKYNNNVCSAMDAERFPSLAASGASNPDDNSLRDSTTKTCVDHRAATITHAAM